MLRERAGYRLPARGTRSDPMPDRQHPQGALDLPSLLAYLYQPVLPILKKIQISRTGTRRYNPGDILLPDGYAAEVVATGFNAPVHCCFDADGACYVTEAGHKIDSQPRVLKVDLTSGAWTPFFELPADRWIKTGA